MLQEQVLEALREVVDPEIGVNVVDLGLVYRADVVNGEARVAMTMTSPACPLHEYLTGAAQSAIVERVPGVESVRVEIVWDPPWHPDMMSEAARRQLS